MRLNLKYVLLIAFFLFSTVANAWLVPVLQGAARALTLTIKGLNTSEKVALGASTAVHVGIFALTFGEDDPNAQAPLTVHLKPNVPLSVPAGWQAATNGDQQPVPPNNIGAPPLKLIATDGSGEVQGDYAAFCVAHQGAVQGTYHHHLDTGAALYCYYETSPGNINTSKKADWLNVCPTGYGLSGPINNQTCALVNAQIVMKPSDQKCEIIVTGNTFQLDTRDPDCTNPNLAAEGIERLDNKVTVTKPNHKVSVTINPDGSKLIESTLNKTDGNTQKQKIAIDADGNKTGEIIEDYKGQGDLTSANPMGSNSSTIGGTVNVDFPDDYNREITQQAIKGDTAEIKKNTKDTFDEIKKQFESTAEENVDTSAHEFDEADYGNIRNKESEYTGILSGLTSKFGIPAGGQCSNASIPVVMFGQSTSWDFQPICNSLAPLVNYLVWMLVSFFVWREIASMRGSA